MTPEQLAAATRAVGLQAERTAKDTRAIDWIIGDDTGISSKAIWAVMMGATLAPRMLPFDGVPHDASDFGHCYRLLELMPEWRPRMPEMARVSEVWARFAANWSVLETLYCKGLPSELSAACAALRTGAGK